VEIVKEDSSKRSIKLLAVVSLQLGSIIQSNLAMPVYLVH